MNECEMSGACSAHGRDVNCIIFFVGKKPGQSKHLGVDGRIILKLISGK
jgi:hypothetical protein